MNEKGYILFDCQLQAGSDPSAEVVGALEHWRSRLFALGLIGVYPNGIGFGNISLRLGLEDRFVISGTRTGEHSSLSPSQYATVESCDFESNSLICTGKIRASSESLSHAAVYRSSSDVNAVLHVHDSDLWKRLFGNIPTTDRDALPGTPEMAFEIMRLMETTEAQKRKLLVMGGHEEGLLAYGKTLAEAGEALLKELRS